MNTCAQCGANNPFPDYQLCLACGLQADFEHAEIFNREVRRKLYRKLLDLLTVIVLSSSIILLFLSLSLMEQDYEYGVLVFFGSIANIIVSHRALYSSKL